MEFKYPKKITEFNLNSIIQHAHGRTVKDKSVFASMRLISSFVRKFNGKQDYISAFYNDDFEVAYKAALGVANSDPVAASLVYHMSLNGIGCAQDKAIASHWLKVAAEGGEPVAMSRFGRQLLETNPSLSFRLMRDSFLSGNEFSGILLMDAALTVRGFGDTPSFKEIEAKLIENAKLAVTGGFDKAGVLLDAYNSAFNSKLNA